MKGGYNMAKNSPQEKENRLYFSTKLNELLYSRNKKQIDLHRDLNIPKSTITGYVKGTSLPTGGNLQKIADYFNVLKSDLDLRFVKDLHSNAPTTISSDVQAIVDVSVQLETPRQHNVLAYAKNQLQEQSKIIQVDFSVKEEETEYQTVYLYGAASAGKGLDLYDEVIEEIQYPKPVPTHDIALRVHGDSMEPMFRDDEIIFVKKSHEIHHGQIGVFVLNGQGYLKKFYRDADGLKLVSLNKKYDDIVVQEFDELQLTGVVVM